MIRIDEGKVAMQGDICMLLTEFTTMIHAFREMTGNKFGNEIADLIISECGRLAYRTDEELRDEGNREAWKNDVLERIKPLAKDRLRELIEELED